MVELFEAFEVIDWGIGEAIVILVADSDMARAVNEYFPSLPEGDPGHFNSRRTIRFIDRRLLTPELRHLANHSANIQQRCALGASTNGVGSVRP